MSRGAPCGMMTCVPREGARAMSRAQTARGSLAPLHCRDRPCDSRRCGIERVAGAREDTGRAPEEPAPCRAIARQTTTGRLSSAARAVCRSYRPIHKTCCRILSQPLAHARTKGTAHEVHALAQLWYVVAQRGQYCSPAVALNGGNARTA